MKKYIVKIDVSGIQKFIFDIPSKGAAKQLKARSFYVFAIPHIVQKMLEDTFQKSNVEIIYNGGGNLFAKVQGEEKALQAFRTLLNEQEFEGNLFPFMSFVEEKEDFKASMSALAKEVMKVKLQRQFSTTPKEAKKSFDWREFITTLTEGKAFNVEKQKAEKNEISLGEYRLAFADKGFSFEGNILNKLPKDREGKVVEFEKIAQKALDSGADDKIAALKMDVDNLGTLFRGKDKREYKQYSQAMGVFFSKTIYKDVLKDYIDKQEVYPVFAGGDDLFFIGSWHIMPEVAEKIKQGFETFAKGLDLALTLSGGIVLAHYSYPMIRLAEEAEEALELAKANGKDSITLFGQPMKWREYEKCKKLKDTFYDLIVKKGESKALLQRLKSSDLGFLSHQDKTVKKKKISLPKVYRLKYYLRNAKNDVNEKILEQIFDDYAEALLDDFLGKDQKLNPAIFAVAARWTELLVRNKKIEKDA